ncbi:MAG: mycothiol system anti-sigma-R factor [Nocardioides sp.]
MAHEPRHLDCADVLEQIVYFLDNELDDADIADVRHHLDLCSPCFASYDLQRTVKALVARSCAEPAPAELKQRVIVSIRQVRMELGDS